jgi:hypothetical protein
MQQELVFFAKKRGKVAQDDMEIPWAICLSFATSCWPRHISLDFPFRIHATYEICITKFMLSV